MMESKGYSDWVQTIRKRPAFYVGAITSQGTHYILFELLDGVIEEHSLGFGREIVVELLPAGTCRLSDNGRGLPVDDPQFGDQSLEEILTTFPPIVKKEPFRPPISQPRWGLFGLYLSVINALSEALIVEFSAAGRRWRQEFARGLAKTKLDDDGPSNETGLRFTWRPDPLIFTTEEARTFQWSVIRDRLFTVAAIYPTLTLELKDLRDKPHRAEIIHFPEGVRDYVRFLNTGIAVLHDEILHEVERVDEGTVEVALQWTPQLSSQVVGIVNGRRTQRGTHIKGFWAALTPIINAEMTRQSIARRPRPKSQESFGVGLTAVVAVKHAGAMFESKEREFACNSEYAEIVSTCTIRCLTRFFDSYPGVGKTVLGNIMRGFG